MSPVHAVVSKSLNTAMGGELLSISKGFSLLLGLNPEHKSIRYKEKTLRLERLFYRFIVGLWGTKCS